MQLLLIWPVNPFLISKKCSICFRNLGWVGVNGNWYASARVRVYFVEVVVSLNCLIVSTLPQRLNRYGLAIARLRRVRQEQGEASRPSGMFDASYHVSQDRLAGVGDDETDRIGLRPSRRTGYAILRVTGLVDRPEHTRARPVTHRESRVEDMRDRRYGNSGDPGDVADVATLVPL